MTESSAEGLEGHNKEQAGAWFERGAHNIETAQLLLDKQG